ncbi:MAG: bifunctional adenosylcobinamide kinase/adenosylcobinamide-phosphate guanylyltransferase [Syntrophomonadaceae bacterium]|nr:bifunctional adenosylcobinamide kinase/adenosylcobinamide-phosphate guanylyltransferase [Syntrophomonadaceae bacterium]
MSFRGKMVLVTGAARSGKSSFAEKMAAFWGGKVIYIATCIPGDAEMRERVALHQARRPDDWETVEEPFNPVKVIKEKDAPQHIFLLDCLTLLITNLILACPREEAEEIVLQKVEELARVSYESAAPVVIVTNEVGWGIVPVDNLSRVYRDIAGRTNQIMASYADEVYLTVAGIPVELKKLAGEMGKSDWNMAIE